MVDVRIYVIRHELFNVSSPPNFRFELPNLRIFDGLKRTLNWEYNNTKSKKAPRWSLKH